MEVSNNSRMNYLTPSVNCLIPPRIISYLRELFKPLRELFDASANYLIPP